MKIALLQLKDRNHEHRKTLVRIGRDTSPVFKLDAPENDLKCLARLGPAFNNKDAVIVLMFRHGPVRIT